MQRVALQVYNKKYKREEDEAIPESLMLGLYFQGNRVSFDKAAEKGEIVKVNDASSSVAFWAFKRLTVGVEEGKSTEHSTHGQQKLTGQDLQALKSAFRNLNWKFNFNSDNPVGDSAGVTSQAKALLEQAIQALDKLNKDAKGLIGSWSGGAEMLAEVKKGYGAALNHISQMNHIKELEQFQDGTAVTENGFYGFMKQVAAQTETFHISVQKAKGENRARTSRGSK